MRVEDEFPQLPAGVLHTIQLAALDPALWQRALGQIVEFVGMPNAHLIGTDQQTGTTVLSAQVGFDPSDVKLYEEYFATLNPWVAPLLANPIGKVVSTYDLVPHDALMRSEFHADWLGPHGNIALGAGAVLQSDGQRHFQIGGNLSLAQGEEAVARLVTVLSQIMPFVTTSLEVNTRMASRTLSSLLVGPGGDLGQTAVLILDEGGRIVLANPAGEALIEQGRLVRRDLRNRLLFREAHVARRFERVRRGGALGTGRVDLGRPGQPSIHAITLGEEGLELFPFWARGLMALPLCAVVIAPPEEAPDETSLAAKLGLTAAQSDVVRLLSEGMSLRQIAEFRGTSLTTARNQLKAALERTGTRRQADLILLFDRARRVRV